MNGYRCINQDMTNSKERGGGGRLEEKLKKERGKTWGRVIQLPGGAGAGAGVGTERAFCILSSNSLALAKRGLVSPLYISRDNSPARNSALRSLNSR